MKAKGLIRLKKIISRFNQAKILIIGDLVLDEFIWGKVERISPEAPVPVVWVDRESFMPGGASNVANNIRALGGEVYLSGVVGEDQRGKILLDELNKRGIDTEGVFMDARRPTVLKTRVIAHHQQVVRIDREKVDPIEEVTLEKITSYLRRKIAYIDALIIEDYGKGVITPRLIREVVSLARRQERIVTVDPKIDHFSYYRQTTAITPNQKEAESATKIKIHDDASLNKVGLKLLNRLKCEAVLITLGENGMCLFEGGTRIAHIPTVAQEVFDVSGAGDTVIGAFTLALASGADKLEAAHISNYAAGVVVGKVGIAVVSQGELEKRIRWRR